MSQGGWLPLARVHLGEAYLLAERLEEASDEATRALALARERGERAYEAYALWLSGEIAVERGEAKTLRSGTARRWRSPGSSGCGPSPPAATSASAVCIVSLEGGTTLARSSRTPVKPSTP